MIRNWLVIAIRNLMRHRLYSAINIIGLAVGLAAAMTIALLLRHELSYDNQFAAGDRIWRLNRTEIISGRPPEPMAAQSFPLASALAQAFPELETVVRIGRAREILRIDGESQYQTITLVDPAYFTLFDWTFLEGDRATALAQPDRVVLTQSTASRLFRHGSALGRTVEMGDGRLLTVSGVMVDPPSNSSFYGLEMLTATTTQLPRIVQSQEDWGSNWLHIFTLVKPGTDVPALQQRLRDFLVQVRPGASDEAESGFRAELWLQPLHDLHLNPVDASISGRTMVLGLTALAAIILAVASINFINLSTARGALRAREVALRKALGAPRHLVVMQFLGESLLLTLLAGLVATAWLEISFPLLQTYFGLVIDPAFRQIGWVAGSGLVMALALGLLGGFYPAVMLSGYRPATILRGGKIAAAGGGRLRAFLVVLQFTVAIALAIGTATVIAQTRHAASRDLGFDRENVVLLRGLAQKDAKGKLDVLKARLNADPGVIGVAAGPRAPGDPSENTVGYTRREVPGLNLTMRTEQVDFGYFKVLDIPVIAGRVFEEERGTDLLPPEAMGDPAQRLDANVILSRSAVRQLGWLTPQEALGRSFAIPGDIDVRLTVIGVVEDVQYKSARDATVATVYLAAPYRADLVFIRLRGGDVPAKVQRLEEIWREVIPQVPLRREFLDQQIDRLYADYVQMARIAAGFAGLAILIACLGLFGLASFTAERRTKEIGIRKVLGAGVLAIVRLLIWQFSRPVLLAILLAWGIAGIVLSHWLAGFAYRVPLDPLLFLIAGGGALVIAWVTVAGHAARVAMAKPVQALRYE